MAPELLLHGRASKASDVYAYGILLWELSTGRRPYSGTPVGMLAHKVVQQGWRPAWPGGCCLPVQTLTEACWAQDPNARYAVGQLWWVVSWCSNVVVWITSRR
jgi:serine/threonine protein kinase